MNQERNTIHTKQVRAAGISALLATAMLAGAGVSILAPGTARAADPGPTCEAGKLGTSAKYASCRLKADSKAAKAGTSADYSKCNLAKFASAEVKAGMGVCPTEADQTTVKDYLDDCTSTAALWLGGGGGLPDTCDGDLSTCEGDLVACEASAGGLPSTGQTTDYGPGSDGAAQRGAPRSFTDNGDGTITDNVTGLMWEKKSDDGSIHDKDDTYTWGMTSAPYTMDGTVVTTFLAALNGGGGFAGHTDWRIPNLTELESLRNLENFSPSTFSEFNNACTGGCTVTTCSCTRSYYHWSSSTYRNGEIAAWVVYFNDGDTDALLKTGSGSVRAVRAGS